MSKFLTYEDRLVIAQLLQENVSFGVIGKKLGKDRTTIAKEIKKHSYDKKSGRPGYPYNPCKHRSTCKAKKLCGNSCTHQSAYKCSLCSECTLHCPDFAEDICSVKTKPPYVCNGCSQLPKCTLLKRIYDPADAHEMAHQSISESRTGILSNEDNIARINGIISPLVKNGQSLHQIYIAFEFASWISAEFKLYIIKDYKRLKADENSRFSLNWNLNREISKLNYRIHTDAIKEKLIPPELTPAQISFTYANEADMLNVVLFGRTAKQWKDENPDIKGNMRDGATLNQLLILANLESYNAVLIHQGKNQKERMELLRQLALQQIRTLESISTDKLPRLR